MSSKETRIFYDTDADPARLQNRVVAVIGYGSQGHAHALNLRDSGVGAPVIVGLRPGGASWERARAEDLDVRPVAEAARAADVIMMLVPDQEGRAVYEAGVAPALQRGKTLLFAHGFNIHFREIVPPAGVDVAMIAPKSPDTWCAASFRRAGACPRSSPCTRMRAATRWPMRSPMPRGSAVPARACSRRRSVRRRRRICSASRPSCAAASPR